MGLATRLLVVGAKGLLGSEVVASVRARALTHALTRPILVTAVDLPELDITDRLAVRRTVAGARPDVILNCAASTDVDGCETRRDKAFAVNADGPRHLAEAAEEAAAHIVHLSTDFVFDGMKGAPYVEDDPPRPLSAYGESKFAGETAIRATTGRHLIVRTSWLFGKGGRNFVTTILKKAREGGRLRVVSDQTGCPTYAKDLAVALLAAIRRRLTGTYHLSNAGSTTWCELARAAVEIAGLSVEVLPIATHEWPRPARVPAYSVLSCEKARRDMGLTLRPWREALEEFIHVDLGLPGKR